MAKAKHKISKQTKTILFLAGTTLLAVALLAFGIFVLPKWIRGTAPVPEGDEGTSQTPNTNGGSTTPNTNGGSTTPNTNGTETTVPEPNGSTTKLPPAIDSEPLPKSTFLKKGKEGAFSYDLYEDYAVITRVETSIVTAEIPAVLEEKPVMAIGENAFLGCSMMTSVTLPDTVREIGRCAFFGCDLLPGISLPETMNTIGESAFANCATLAQVKIPGSVKNIGLGVFDGTAFLENAKEDFILVGDGLLIAYKGEGGTISLPSEVKKIVSLSSCETLTGLYIPMGVTEIGDYALTMCTNVSTLVIPSTVTRIGAHAFNGCESLTGVNTGTGLVFIGDGAFSFCANLKTVVFSKTVLQIGEDLFQEVTTLERINVTPESFANEYFKTGKYASLVHAEEV